VTCNNVGKCQVNSARTDASCVCEGNYIGKYCERCKDGFKGDYCNICADSNFTGDQCDEPVNTHCSPNPCVNGLCESDSTGFYCICAEGSINMNLCYFFNIKFHQLFLS
jgi:hypothetical protein